MYIIIVGCGRVGSELANLLQNEGHNVVIIDNEPESFKRLGSAFNGVTLVGNGFDVELLKEAGIEKADAFCVVTNGDNTNIMAAQVAKKIFNVPKVIARIYDPKRAHIYKHLGLDVISGTVLFAAMLRDKIIESHFTGYLIETGELGVIEIPVKANLIGKKVSEVNIPDEFIAATIVRKKGSIIPGPDTRLEKNDLLMGVVKTTALARVKKIFGI
ncbi:MAG: TrkA family potassium uptake protein [Candidatus Omnitrophica bacterium]|nr:TrkA family potassium uptake protein [Candidatus Omnitrophota bacterium]